MGQIMAVVVNGLSLTPTHKKYVYLVRKYGMGGGLDQDTRHTLDPQLTLGLLSKALFIH
jgi:hypothetical protein